MSASSDSRPDDARAARGRASTSFTSGSRPTREAADAQHMVGSGITTAELGALVRGGDYVVDTHAVAEAMVRSGVLVAAQPWDRLSVRPFDDQAGAGPDLA
jgi:hypothetical protein